MGKARRGRLLSLVMRSTTHMAVSGKLTVCQSVVSDDISGLVEEDEQDGGNCCTVRFCHQVSFHTDGPCNVYAEQKTCAKEVSWTTSETRYNKCQDRGT